MRDPRKSSFSDEAYEVAKDRIVSGVYLPDSFIDDRALANELGVSRTPVREALIRLSNEGLVEFVPRRGIRVVPVSLDALSEAFDVITAMEFMAVDLIVRMPERDDVIADLESCAEAMRDARAADNVEAWIDAAEDYHRTLLARCGNNDVTRIGFSLRDKIHRILRVAKRLWAYPEEPMVAHANLVEAIRNADGVIARRVWYRYRRTKETRLIECLRRTGVEQF